MSDPDRAPEKMSRLEAVSHLLGLKDSSIPEFGVLIVGFLRDDGSQAYSFAALGGADSAVVLGVLEMVKHDVLNRIKESE
jgi:hypothetical protein